MPHVSSKVIFSQFQSFFVIFSLMCFFSPKGYCTTCPEEETRAKLIEHTYSRSFSCIFKLFLQEGDFQSISVIFVVFSQIECFVWYDIICNIGHTRQKTMLYTIYYALTYNEVWYAMLCWVFNIICSMSNTRCLISKKSLST